MPRISQLAPFWRNLLAADRPTAVAGFGALFYPRGEFSSKELHPKSIWLHATPVARRRYEKTCSFMFGLADCGPGFCTSMIQDEMSINFSRVRFNLFFERLLGTGPTTTMDSKSLMWLTSRMPNLVRICQGEGREFVRQW